MIGFIYWLLLMVKMTLHHSVAHQVTSQLIHLTLMMSPTMSSQYRIHQLQSLIPKKKRQLTVHQRRLSLKIKGHQLSMEFTKIPVIPLSTILVTVHLSKL